MDWSYNWGIYLLDGSSYATVYLPIKYMDDLLRENYHLLHRTYSRYLNCIRNHPFTSTTQINTLRATALRGGPFYIFMDISSWGGLFGNYFIRPLLHNPITAGSDRKMH